MFSLPSLAQDLNRKISLNVKNKPLSEALNEVAAKGSISFSYNPQVVPLNKPVTIKAKNKPVREVLDRLLGGIGIGWVLVENHIVLKPGGLEARKETAEPGYIPKKYTISGFVKEKSSGEALIGVNVYIRGTQTGTNTNAYGYYSLTVPEGDVSLVFSFLGYQDIIHDLTIKSNDLLSVDLEEAILQMKEVEIVADDKPTDLQNNQLSEIHFSNRTLNQMPGFAGSPDLIKALQSVPGIRSYGDGSSLFYVRGGNYDQNLLILDEVPIYNPSHLFGFFSAFSPDAINDVQVYKGDFPARYGGRLSSVVNINTKEGNMKRFGFSGNLGPYASYLSLEGPIVKDRCSFFISGRLATLNWLNYFMDKEQNFRVGFYDINAKVNARVSGRDHLYFTFYTGQDHFSRDITSSYETYGVKWDNIAATFRWNHLFNSRFFSNTTAGYSRYRYFLYLSTDEKDFWESSISNLTLKSDLTWFIYPKNTFQGGFEITSHWSDPGNVTFNDPENPQPAPEVAKYNAMEYVLYLSDGQIFWNKLNLDVGIRLPLWQDLGPTTIYYFDANYHPVDTARITGNKSYFTAFSPEPRISLKYSINAGMALRASYNRTTQFMQILSNTNSPFNSLEVWTFSGPNIKPQIADQFTLGYFGKLFRSRINISAEGFYKSYQNYIDYRDHANLLYNPLIEGELRQGKAWSYGLELMVKKAEGKFTGWISYTYSRSMVKTPDVNSGNAYPTAFDSPNDICINVAFDTRKHWSFSATWIYRTGSPFTGPTGFYYYNGYSVPVFDEKHNVRLPDYHRLDLAVKYQISKPMDRFQHFVILTIYNAYGRMNPFSVSFNKFEDPSGSFVVPTNLTGAHELVPTSLSVAGIIPSINYQFKF